MSGQLKEVRERITSVKSTQQITKAMKMVSAAKLRRAQEAITEMRPYADRLNKMLKNILSNLDGDVNSSYGADREAKKICIVVVTSNRGLCGGFNTNIVKEAVRLLEDKYAMARQAKQIDLVFVGKKGHDSLKKRYADLNQNIEYIDLFSDLSFENIKNVPDYLMQTFSDEQYDRIEVCYGKFKNAALQFAQAVQYLPVEKVTARHGKEKSPRKADYIFEPGKEELLEDLIPSILQTTFQKFLLDTHASEHGARMTAMDNATENAEDLIKELKINYNKARQEAITKELSEIVGGAAALGG